MLRLYIYIKKSPIINYFTIVNALLDAFRCALLRQACIGAQPRLAGRQRNRKTMPRTDNAFVSNAQLFDRRVVKRSTKVITNSIQSTTILTYNGRKKIWNKKTTNTFSLNLQCLCHRHLCDTKRVRHDHECRRVCVASAPNAARRRCTHAPSRSAQQSSVQRAFALHIQSSR